MKFTILILYKTLIIILVLTTNHMKLLIYLCRFFKNTFFPGVVGCIDCTHVAIVPPKYQNGDVPEYVFVNRKVYHSLKVQLVNIFTKYTY